VRVGNKLMSTLVAETTSGKIRMLAGRANGIQAYAASATELRAWRVLGPASRTVHRQDHTSVLDEIGKAAREEGVTLIPVERRRDVEIRSRLGNQSILGHRSGFARLGSRRYSASRSLARLRCDFGAGSCPGPFAMRSVAVIQKRKRRVVAAYRLVRHCLTVVI